MSLSKDCKSKLKEARLVQDGVETMRERPQDEEQQKLYYSGKKRLIHKRTC